ncbi:MAG TPA: hypothetical protein VFN35_30500 [Ktedonobacteraceae bacterium]|nr:hypothetical protein [Ktedonobacteraceae bacterium]
MEHRPATRPHGQPVSKLRSGPSIPGHNIQYDEQRHVLVIDQVLLSCTLPEYQCLKQLLESVDRCVTFDTFGVCLEQAPGLDARHERMRLAHIMSALRARLWPLGLDIVSVMNRGYILLSQPDLQEPQ